MPFALRTRYQSSPSEKYHRRHKQPCRLASVSVPQVRMSVFASRNSALPLHLYRILRRRSCPPQGDIELVVPPAAGVSGATVSVGGDTVSVCSPYFQTSKVSRSKVLRVRESWWHTRRFEQGIFEVRWLSCPRGLNPTRIHEGGRPPVYRQTRLSIVDENLEPGRITKVFFGMFW